MIREFDAESSLQQTASSATQSAISLISVEDPKIVHKLARFLDARGPEKLRWGRQRLASARFSPSRTEPVPLGYLRLRIHSEPLMLDIEIVQSTVARYMTKRQERSPKVGRHSAQSRSVPC